MSASSPPFRVDRVGDVDVVHVAEPKMTYATLESLQGELSQRIDDGNRKLVIDLAPVSFLDSFGIGVIVATARKMAQAGGRLKLCGVGERVQMSLTITRLDRTLDIAMGHEAQGCCERVPIQQGTGDAKATGVARARPRARGCGRVRGGGPVQGGGRLRGGA